MSQKSTNSVQTIKIDELIPDPQNARSHPEENKEAIEASLKRFGAARSIVVDSEGVVRAGSGTLEAAKKLGYKTIKIVETDGKELVAVFRPDWTEQEAVGYGIADNRTAELAEWNKENLEEIVSGLKDVDLKDLGFSENDLANIFAQENFENSNQEINVSGFEDEMQMTFKFTSEQYWKVKDKLEEFGEDPSLALLKALHV
jgi:hypothetical protein